MNTIRYLTMVLYEGSFLFPTLPKLFPSYAVTRSLLIAR